MEILGSFQTSVRRALGEIDPSFESLPGLIVCGSHSPDELNLEYILDRIKQARETGEPFLGICFGHQLAAIQYARDVLGIADATSEEFGKGTFVVKRRPQMKVGLHDGESYWSNFEVSIEWEKPGNFITTPYHPEYQSVKDRPHWDLVAFLNLCYIWQKKN